MRLNGFDLVLGLDGELHEASPSLSRYSFYRDATKPLYYLANYLRVHVHENSLMYPVSFEARHIGVCVNPEPES